MYYQKCFFIDALSYPHFNSPVNLDGHKYLGQCDNLYFFLFFNSFESCQIHAHSFFDSSLTPRLYSQSIGSTVCALYHFSVFFGDLKMSSYDRVYLYTFVKNLIAKAWMVLFRSTIKIHASNIQGLSDRVTSH